MPGNYACFLRVTLASRFREVLVVDLIKVVVLTDLDCASLRSSI